MAWSEAGTAGSTAEGGSSSVPGRCSRICMRPSKNPAHAALPAPAAPPPHPPHRNCAHAKSDTLRHNSIIILTALRTCTSGKPTRTRQFIQDMWFQLQLRKIVL